MLVLRPYNSNAVLKDTNDSLKQVAFLPALPYSVALYNAVYIHTDEQPSGNLHTTCPSLASILMHMNMLCILHGEGDPAS